MGFDDFGRFLAFFLPIGRGVRVTSLIFLRVKTGIGPPDSGDLKAGSPAYLQILKKTEVPFSAIIAWNPFNIFVYQKYDHPL